MMQAPSKLLPLYKRQQVMCDLNFLRTLSAKTGPKSQIMGDLSQTFQGCKALSHAQRFATASSHLKMGDTVSSSSTKMSLSTQTGTAAQPLRIATALTLGMDQILLISTGELQLRRHLSTRI